MIIKEKFKVLLKDIGKNNCIKNIGLLEMLENIATHHSDSLGFGPNNVQEKGFVWILLDWRLQVFRRPKYGEILEVHTWARDTEKMKRTCTYRDFEIYDESNKLCAIATSKWVMVDISTGRISRISEDIIEKYQIENKNVFNEDELDKITIPESFNKEMSYKVARRDIDLNRHVHNLNYLYFAYEALPDDVYENRPYNNLRIQYKKEIKYGEMIKFKYSFENEKHIVTIFNEDESRVHAVVILY